MVVVHMKGNREPQRFKGDARFHIQDGALIVFKKGDNSMYDAVASFCPETWGWVERKEEA